MVEGRNEISFIKCFAQALARGGRCYYSHLQVFRPATDSRGRFMESGWKHRGDRFQTPSKEDLPQGGRTTSGSGVPSPEHRRAEVRWLLGIRLQSKVSHCDAGAAALAGSLLEMQILVLYPRPTESETAPCILQAFRVSMVHSGV